MLIEGKTKPTVWATREPYDRVARKEWNMIKTALSGKIFRNAVLIIGFAFLVAGCGGSGGDSSSSGGSVINTSTTVTGLLQASYINGAKICVNDSFIGTTTENCNITKNQGNFSIANAVGKNLAVLIDTVIIETIPADQVFEIMIITPALMSGGDTEKAQRITEIFHQAGSTTDNRTYDMSSIRATDIDTATLSEFLGGTVNTIRIGPMTVVHDVTAPTIVSVSASPSTVSPGQTLTISARVTDTTGVQYVGLQADLNGTQASWCGYSASLVSGSATDGTWALSCTVPTTVNSGIYNVYPYANDTLGNMANINGGPTTSLRGSFTITGGLNDVTAPTIVSVSASPSAVSPGQTLTISARVTDTTGVQYVGLQADLNGTQASWCGYSASRVSGSATDGIWALSCTVPITVNSGTYNVLPYAQDTPGNWANMNGGPTTPLRGSFTITY